MIVICLSVCLSLNSSVCLSVRLSVGYQRLIDGTAWRLNQSWALQNRKELNERNGVRCWWRNNESTRPTRRSKEWKYFRKIYISTYSFVGRGLSAFAAASYYYCCRICCCSPLLWSLLLSSLLLLLPWNQLKERTAWKGKTTGSKHNSQCPRPRPGPGPGRTYA